MTTELDDHAQRHAVLNPAKSFIVQAPAGSGKTGLLVRRFLVLLGLVSEPEEILAITFTRKATAEMRQRIVDALTQAENAKGSIENDDNVVELAKNALKQDSRRNWNILDNPRRLRIQTIDAFCYQIVRNMPWSARFGSAPEVLENMAISNIYREAAKNTLQHVDSNDYWSGHCANVLMLVNARFWRAQELLVMMMGKRDRWMRGLRLTSRKELEEMWRQVVEQHLELAYNLIPDQIRMQITKAAVFAASHPYQPRPNAVIACVDIGEFPDNQTHNVALWKGIAAMLLTEKRTLRKSLDVRVGFPPENKEEKSNAIEVLNFLRTKPEIVAALSWIPLLPSIEFFDKRWDMLDSLLQILPLAGAELQTLFRQNNVADYIEIAQRAEFALGQMESPSDLALALDQNINHILMDEVQDTSGAQMALLKKITQGWDSSDGRTLFFVGDPMQSIYRFREAEVAHFLEIQKSGIGSIAVECVALSSNFRSTGALIEWFNASFEAVFNDVNSAVGGSVPYSPSTPVQLEDRRSRIYLHPELDGSQIAEAKSICAQIKREQELNPKSEIGILGRTRRHLLEIARELRQNDIDYQAIELENLSQRPVIQDLMALTRAVLQPADRVAWLSVLHAPWCGAGLDDLTMLAGDEHNRCIVELAQEPGVAESLSRDGGERIQFACKVMSDALEMRGRVSLSTVVESVWLKLGGPYCAESSDLDDCDVYFRMLDDMEKEQAVINAQSLKETLSRIWSTPGDISSVQLLTIHKSKGLEFDVVFLPQLHARPPTQDRSLLRWTRLPNQLLVAAMPRNANDQDLFYNYLGELEKQYDRDELRRLVYVACTRAKSTLHLYMSVSRDSKGVIKPPSNNSLLEILWPAIRNELETSLSDTPSSDSRVESHSTQQSYRLRKNWILPDLVSVTEQSISPKNVGLGRDDQIEFSWAGETARITGTVIHRLLEGIGRDEWDKWKSRGEDSFLPYCKTLLRENGLNDDLAADGMEYIRTTLNNLKTDPQADWIFSPNHRRIRKEWPLTSFLYGKFQRVIIDRSFIDENEIQWIIDFKTSRHDDEDVDQFLDNELRRYQNQLDLYATIVSRLSPHRIKCGLYFPMLKGWREWEFR